MLTRCYEVPLDSLLHLSIEYGTSHFTRKMADRGYQNGRYSSPAILARDVNASMPISILLDRSDSLKFIVAGARVRGFDSPFRGAPGAPHGRTARAHFSETR